MVARSLQDVERVWKNVEGIKRLSDRVVGVGPFGIGLDGLLAWIPGINVAYGVGAGGLLMLNAVQAKASPSTLTRMLAYLVADNLTDAVPFVGWAVDTVFPGHLMAAKALQKDIETTHWVGTSERAARASGEHERHLADARAAKRRRVVYFED